MGSVEQFIKRHYKKWAHIYSPAATWIDEGRVRVALQPTDNNRVKRLFFSQDPSLELHYLVKILNVEYRVLGILNEAGLDRCYSVDVEKRDSCIVQLKQFSTEARNSFGELTTGYVLKDTRTGFAIDTKGESVIAERFATVETVKFYINDGWTTSPTVKDIFTVSSVDYQIDSIAPDGYYTCSRIK